MPNSTPIAILGAGSWGTALALHLARMGHVIQLWSIEKDEIEEMQKNRKNARYLPEAFPDSIHPTADLAEALNHVINIVIAVPSVGFRTTLQAIKPLLHQNERIITATKGMDLETGDFFHHICSDILGNEYPYAVISGPSFAKEIAQGLPTAIVAACKDVLFAKEVFELFNHSRFRVYLSKDVIGVEIAGCVKNILAIACGISDGMNLGASARSALLTRGLAEMIRLGTALGAEYETFMGLSGVGDLVLTCCDDKSRNRRFGLALGRGTQSHTAEQEIGQVVEGKRNTELIIQLAKTYNVDMPISEAVLAILKGKFTATEAMESLLSREIKP